MIKGATLIEGNEYLTVGPESYIWTKGAMKFKLTIPAGFNTDFASYPWWGKYFGFKREDTGWIRASKFHDWLYFIGPVDMNLKYPGSYQYLDINDQWSNCISIWKRKEADQLFNKIMEEDGFLKRRRLEAYWAVRLFGGIHCKRLFW